MLRQVVWSLGVKVPAIWSLFTATGGLPMRLLRLWIKKKVKLNPKKAKLLFVYHGSLPPLMAEQTHVWMIFLDLFGWVAPVEKVMIRSFFLQAPLVFPL